jgi:DUF2934 family protein
MASPSTATQRATETKAGKPMEALAKKSSEVEDVFEHFDRIYDKLARRAFEIFSSNGKGFGHDLENWFQAESEQTVTSPVRLLMLLELQTEECVSGRNGRS